MKSNSVLDLLQQGRFFPELDQQVWKGRPGDLGDLIPWLRLLRTTTIQSWAEDSKAIQKVIDGRARPGEEVLSLLLQRHLLHLETRRDPTTLQRFWRWAVPKHGSICRFWEQLPSTLDHVYINIQEREFGRIVETATAALSENRAPSWIVTSLSKIVQARSIPARVPIARVVFAVSTPRLDIIRPGVLVNFRLLAHVGRASQLQDEHVFDDAFRRALQEDIGNRVDQLKLRRIEHDCGFLDPGMLSGTSGTMALLIAHVLLSPGRKLQRRPWAMPPWLVVSATVNCDTPSTGDGGAVGNILAKIEVLAEEGIRVLAVSNQSSIPDSLFDDLKVLPYSGTADAFGEALLKNNYLVSADLSSLDPRLVTGSDPGAGARVRERNVSHLLHFDSRADYLAPEYAFDAICAGIARLSGKGFLHLTAPAGQGKSVLVRAFGEGRSWEDFPPRMGKTLGYTLLPGEPASPSIFLNVIENQARGFDPFFLFSERVADATDVPTVQRFLCSFLAELRSAVCRRDEPLILAVDGVDELPRDASTEAGILPLLLDLLPPPNELPSGCYILLTSRPNVPSHISDAFFKLRTTRGTGLFQEVVLSKNDESYLSLLEEYLVRGLGDEVRPLVPAILKRSQGQFLYVRLLRDWLRLIRERGLALRGLSFGNLPETDEILPAYLAEFAKVVTRVHRDAERFARWHRPVLLLIAAAHEAVDRETLSFWLGDLVAENPDGDHLLDCTLDDLSPLLKTERRAWLDDRVLYSLGHAELVDWFAQTEHPEWIGAMGEVVERIIARGRTLFTSEVHGFSGEYEHVGLIALYHFRHLASHMLEMEETQAAREFLGSSWQESLYAKYNDMWRSGRHWSEMLECAKSRQAQYLDLLKAACPDDPDYADQFISCLTGDARASLAQIEAHDRLGRSETAIHLSTKLVDLLGSDNALGLLPAFSVANAREHVRLLAEAHISRARALMRYDQNEKALESVRQVYAILPALIAPESGEDWIVWCVTAWAELTQYMICLLSGPGRLLACLEHNREALDFLATVITGETEPGDSLRNYPSLVVAQLRTLADRISLLLRLAEDGLTIAEEDRLESADSGSSPVLTAQEYESPVEAALAICHDTIIAAQTAVEQSPRVRGGDKHAIAKVPQLVTAQGMLFRNQAKVQEAIGDRGAALESYRKAFTIFEEVAFRDCPAALEQLLGCCIEWISLEGLKAQLANGDRSFIHACIQLNVLHKELGRQIATAEVYRCVERFDAWLEVCGLREKLGEEFREDWAATCRTLKRFGYRHSWSWWSGDNADLRSPDT